MTQPNLPPPHANTFLQEVFGNGVSLASTSRDQYLNRANGRGKGLQRITGILDKVTHERRRRIYTSSTLDEGVEIYEDDIRNFRQLPVSKVDGLQYDVVWVDADADIIRFSRRSSPARGPIGGDGGITGEGGI